ncbi:MAG: hypothetical protein ACK4PR_03270 [Gammaproteobacteria bacterium]
MKVTYKESFEYKILQKIESIQSVTILRNDFSTLGDSDRQISRALSSLVKKGRLVRLGYGIYAKLEPSLYRKGETVLPIGFIDIIREALTKMGIPWKISDFEQEYNEGRSTQIPVRPTTIIEKRFRRKISYKNREFPFEYSLRTR